ncbi:predicted protein [Botrytis cinerea T4]|uniref:Uncharacterized protein n=1 Tax=Botryotinia fuckeliana (strain T4) TaxID=999810 RepID=G2YYC9_BOTF4|nr:predicted protein [Botrytis cinerea T4]
MSQQDRRIQSRKYPHVSISSAVYELTQAERLPSDCQADLREPLTSRIMSA